MKNLLATTFIASTCLANTGLSVAGEFDGWCFPATACTGEAMPIRDSSFETCEETCTMRDPVVVNGMDAVLYRVTCEGDWGSPEPRRMFFIRLDPIDGKQRALAVSQAGVEELIRCM